MKIRTTAALLAFLQEQGEHDPDNWHIVSRFQDELVIEESSPAEKLARDIGRFSFRRIAHKFLNKC